MEIILNFLHSLFLFIEKCNTTGILDFIGLILSVIIPLHIMKKTLTQEKNAAKQDAIEREQQYQETLKITERHHKEQLKAQEDINRIAIMPYFTIDCVSAKRESDRIVFFISFKNIGNGTVINLTTKYLESKTLLCPVCQTALATYCCITPFDAYIATARPDERCSLKISQELNVAEATNVDCFCFTLKYTDMKQHPYEQVFAIYFDATDSTDIKIQRKIINNPEVQ